MKKIFVILVALIGFGISANAQTYTNNKLFGNEKLGIYHTVKDGQDVVFTKHFLSFDNLTNNNLRVTYKATCNLWVIKGTTTTTPEKFTYTRTIYVKPKDRTIDMFLDSDSDRRPLWNYVQRNNGRFDENVRIVLVDFELINYGVENKNYETTY